MTNILNSKEFEDLMFQLKETTDKIQEKYFEMDANEKQLFIDTITNQAVQIYNKIFMEKN